MRRLSAYALSVCLSIVLAGIAQASITGTPIGDPSHPLWTPNSTNALNFASQAPTRVGQAAPYVLLNSSTLGSVTLDFFAGSGGQSRFEIRIDGVATGAALHPIVIGDTVHAGPNVHENNVTFPSYLQNTYNASQYVDVRLALGGERDFDFNWTRFEVTAVPEPATIFVWSGIATIAGLAYMRKRRNA